MGASKVVPPERNHGEFGKFVHDNRQVGPIFVVVSFTTRNLVMRRIGGVRAGTRLRHTRAPCCLCLHLDLGGGLGFDASFPNDVGAIASVLLLVRNSWGDHARHYLSLTAYERRKELCQRGCPKDELAVT
jgi:hypothetical protein